MASRASRGGSDHTFWRATPDGVELCVHVRPGGHRNTIEGLHDGALAVRVAASPTKGQANDAVVRTIAHALGLRPRAVSVSAGATSRRKYVLVRGESAALVAAVQELLDVPR